MPFSQEDIVWRLTYTRAARSSCDIPRVARSSRILPPIGTEHRFMRGSVSAPDAVRRRHNT